MRAWHVARYGEPEFRTDIAAPVVDGGDGGDDDQVIVEVEAAAVNFADSLMLVGEYQERPPLPFTPGIELAGTISNPGTSRFSVGDRVVGLAGLGTGSWAEFARCDSRQLVSIPDDVAYIDAVGLHINAQTAWFALHRRAQISPTDTVLVHAAAGGVGALVVQLAAAHGCTVIGTSSAAKTGIAESLGAVACYDNRDPGWADRVRTDHGLVDVVIDPVGGPVFAPSFRLLGFEGRYVTVGFASGDIPTVKTNHALVKNVTLHGLYWTRYTFENRRLVDDAAEEIFGLHRAGRLDPLVATVASMDQAVDRVADVASGRTVGKTVLVWSDTELAAGQPD
jgi:NADPH2:quinone reductase